MKKTEAHIQSEILLALSKRGHRLWRTNAGKVRTIQGHIIKLMPEGFPDTCGFRKSDGKFIAIEVKTPKGRLSPAQKRFAKFAEKQPIIYGVARSVEEAIEIVEERD
ncbi:VRR-NUC domain-containing protein [Dolosicoccus paucivorans]|uniref:VRR-NUC domain-containing protein n=1 Tax=Dolosicoccus paucivorans TaxID=84521 RepID=UPI00087E8CAF|nr:VRR-NUC domain-containing protein [Dolosicoccus paucivorans]SDI40555.1 VRR-NUC domain-containing protein [Dolosicoccus paucivorans]